jgi:site-specific DNA-adenine methylase
MIRAPYLYYGSKAAIAPLVWQCLGAPNLYVEPFGGSLANLLARPTSESTYRETVGDADSLLANFWRAIRYDPGTVAWYAVGPISSVDLQAKHRWLRSQRESVANQMDSIVGYRSENRLQYDKRP